MVANVTNSRLFEPEKKLVRAIKSFINQTHKDKELVIISNGCNKSKLIYQKYFSDRTDIYFFHNIVEIAPIYEGINNKGLEIASGDFVLYLNQNDVLGSKHLETIDKEITKDPNHSIYYYDTYNTLNDTFKKLKKNYIELRVGSVTLNSIAHRRTDIMWSSGVGNDWQFIMEMVYKGYTYKKINNTQYIKGQILYDDLVKNTPDINDGNSKIAVLMHMFYIDLWDEFKERVDDIRGKCDIYVNLVKGSYDDETLNEFKDKISNLPNVDVIISENIGLDVGGTMFLLERLFNTNIEYDYILKIHSKKSIHSGRDDKKAIQDFKKTGEEWREQLTKPIMGSVKTTDDIISLFKSSKEVGMVGGKYNILTAKNKWALRNINFITDYNKRFGITTDPREIIFVAGTMFWVRYDLMKDYFTKVKPLEIASELEEGAFTDATEERRTHALERVFGLMVLNKKMRIIGV